MCNNIHGHFNILYRYFTRSELFTGFKLFICFTISYMVIGLRKKEVILFEINELQE